VELTKVFLLLLGIEGRTTQNGVDDVINSSIVTWRFGWTAVTEEDVHRWELILWSLTKCDRERRANGRERLYISSSRCLLAGEE
jgi:hypothetical protein